MSRFLTTVNGPVSIKKQTNIKGLYQDCLIMCLCSNIDFIIGLIIQCLSELYCQTFMEDFCE